MQLILWSTDQHWGHHTAARVAWASPPLASAYAWLVRARAVILCLLIDTIVRVLVLSACIILTLPNAQAPHPGWADRKSQNTDSALPDSARCRRRRPRETR